MKIDARIGMHETAQGPDPWDEDWGVRLPLDHIICRDVDGTPHLVSEFVWPWTAYTAGQKRCLLHFFYWKQNSNRVSSNIEDITPEREARMRELQFLMTRQIFFGREKAPKTLYELLRYLHNVARFAEERSCTVKNVLSKSTLLDACGESLPDYALGVWIEWVSFLRDLNPETQLGFTLAKPKRWADVLRRDKEYRNNRRQVAPLPTRIYASLINNLMTELDEIEAHKSRLLTALHEAITAHAQVSMTSSRIPIGPDLIEKYNLGAYLEKRGFGRNSLRSIAGAITDVFRVCKLQIHVFSGMRDKEANSLPYHCMFDDKGSHGRKHCLITGFTTKFNKGRRLRTKWVTTELDGFRAIRLAQEFSTAIYSFLDIKPSKDDDFKDNYPLFTSCDYLPWMARRELTVEHISTPKLMICCALAYVHSSRKRISLS